LGVVLYRAGELRDAVNAVDRSVELSREGQVWDWFFHAMAHGRLGHDAQAWRRLDQAAAFLEQQQSPSKGLLSVRIEAAQVLGVEQLP